MLYESFKIWVKIEHIYKSERLYKNTDSTLNTGHSYFEMWICFVTTHLNVAIEKPETELAASWATRLSSCVQCLIMACTPSYMSRMKLKLWYESNIDILWVRQGKTIFVYPSYYLDQIQFWTIFILGWFLPMYEGSCMVHRPEWYWKQK